ncbi:Ribonucleases P/MRP protein subunit POP1, partial [Zancudomyces culisetae]
MARQEGKKRWLETHVWHTKRMRMIEKWGIMVAETPNSKSHRATYLSLYKSMIHDVSFMSTLELVGASNEIIELLGKFTFQKSELSAKMYTNGSKELPLVLYERNDPTKCIGPCVVIWGPKRTVSNTNKSEQSQEIIENDEQKSVVWVRLHPSITQRVYEMFCLFSSTELGMRVSVIDKSLDVMSIDVYGKYSTTLLQSIIEMPVGDGGQENINDSNRIEENVDGSRVWKLLGNVFDHESIPEGLVINLETIDPRLKFPQKLVDP